MSLELLMTSAIKRGLLLSDFEDMTIGMILDYIMFYDDQHSTSKQDEVRDATQADINAFFGRRKG
ncbi:hypothetical protein BK142_23860 [Paenibacillus glucanolyticus]|nr:hypothetical protein BK142_23860 [Paenibacillus glucanolyticus]